MNLPNALTLSRIIITFPVMFSLYFAPKDIQWVIFSAVLYSIAASTDFFDGYIARKRNQITKLGKFMDQISDKFLVTSVFLVFAYQGYTSFWLVFVVVSRDILVSGLRMHAASEGKVIAANYFGKAKTVLQMTFILFVYIEIIVGFDMPIIFQTFQWVVIFVTAISGLTYLKDSNVLSEGGK
ncbi:MAG: CDP-diacylglycerol--glycerol-3-phosphate 3-phosphatidyltransferase [Thermotogota bacterium]|nr:CDP-diacylglycerol--glycerol-3-phosphate 3-phosphatidyltransferase [Thermotogota bacterium]